MQGPLGLGSRNGKGERYLQGLERKNWAKVRLGLLETERRKEMKQRREQKQRGEIRRRKEK